MVEITLTPALAKLALRLINTVWYVGAAGSVSV
ncbi:hypothetical protein E9232_006346 [Inquilinus ginsengisoli]|uniref:Uncharacterized protein n=1 Tax=Inquilinus ginsengisoli TaxID=363840 RepID=A0ABU1JYU6_9PROT|nr:hypothetical protein [Inquilinus ginsengisoli]